VGRLLLTAVLAVALCAPAAQGAVGDVPPGKTLLFVGQSGVDKANAFERGTGVRPAGAMWYLGIYEDGVEKQVADLASAVRTHPGLIVNLGLSFGAASTPSPPYTAAIAAGRYDENIAALAAGLKRLPTVVHLRIGYEFDLLGGQYGPPEVYKAAYRHVVDELHAHGVRNVSYIWHSAGAFWRGTDTSVLATNSGTAAKTVRDTPAPQDAQPIAAFFPGRDYVDGFGISYWQDSCCTGRSAEQARAEYEERTREILAEARAMRLPLHISESTPVYIGANSGAESVKWLDNTFKLIGDFDIRSLALISVDWREGGFFAAPFWNGYWPDARIHHHAATRDRFVAEMKKGRYILRGESAAGTAAPTPGAARRAGAPRADRTAPVVRRVRLATRRGARIASFSVTEASRVTLRVKRGRRVTRTIVRRARRGINRVTTRRPLRRGRYTLVVVAVDAAGNRSRPVTRRFRVR
jgi:hypothetical protein